MKKIAFSIHHYSTISIYTDIDEVYREFCKNQYKILKTIPITNVSVEETGIIGKNNSICIVRGSNNSVNFDVDNNFIFVTIDNDKIRVLDYTYMLLEMFANALANSKRYLLHSAALKYDDDKSIMLVGDANSGKSTLAYYLMQKYGMQLISNDHALIGEEKGSLMTFSGTKPLELRYGVIDKYFPQFRYLLGNATAEDLWSKKIVINDYLGQELIAPDDKTTVSDIFHVDLCEGGVCFLKTKDHIDQRLFLYEHLSKQLKGTYNLITTYDFPMPTIETLERLKTLDSEIKRYLETVEVHTCKGSIDDISEVMVKKLERK